jgi:5-methylcytosine-specific restriction endonuclease McrA
MGYADVNNYFDESKSALVFNQNPRKEEQQQYYAANRLVKQEKIRNRIRLHTLRLNYIKTKAGCTRCNERDPMVLEFNHKVPLTKLFNIGRTKGKSKSWNTIMEEVLKCEILCANCHKRVTAREHGRLGYTSHVCDSGMPT